MAPPILWSFFHCPEDQLIFIKVKDEVKKAYDAVLDAHDHKDRPDYVKVCGWIYLHETYFMAWFHVHIYYAYLHDRSC